MSMRRGAAPAAARRRPAAQLSPLPQRLVFALPHFFFPARARRGVVAIRRRRLARSPRLTWCREHVPEKAGVMSAAEITRPRDGVGDLVGLPSGSVGEACVSDHHLDRINTRPPRSSREPRADDAAGSTPARMCRISPPSRAEEIDQRATSSSASTVQASTSTRWPNSAAWSAVCAVSASSQLADHRILSWPAGSPAAGRLAERRGARQDIAGLHAVVGRQISIGSSIGGVLFRPRFL